MPLKGWSQYDREDGPRCVDYYGRSIGAKWYDPEADRAFLDSLEKHMNMTKSNIEIIKLDLHINDPKLAELTTTILEKMIKGQLKRM